MRKIEVAVIDDAVNAAVIHLPERRFPALALQGDSLSIVASLAQATVAAITEERIVEARESATELLELLRGYQAVYERALRGAGMKLPY